MESRIDNSAFAARLREAIIGAWTEFRTQHPGESPYAFALIEGQAGNYLRYAVATEEGLKRAASQYDRKGYRYQGWEWEHFDNCEKLAVWLRWANPDDGWHYGDFLQEFQIQSLLDELVKAGAFGEDADHLEEFCIEVLASLQEDERCLKLTGGRQVVLGVTSGENPRDFLRTATRCNSYPVVRQLWTEHWQGEDLSDRIKSSRENRK